VPKLAAGILHRLRQKLAARIGPILATTIKPRLLCWLIDVSAPKQIVQPADAEPPICTPSSPAENVTSRGLASRLCTNSTQLLRQSYCRADACRSCRRGCALPAN